MNETGLYVPGKGLLHRWHPLTTVSLALSSVMVAFVPWYRIPYGLAVPVLLTVPLALLAWIDGAGLGAAWIRRLFWLFTPIFLSLMLVQGFFFPGAQEVLWRIGPFALKREGLVFAATIGGRLLLMIGSFLLVLLATHPADLAMALVQIGLPLEVAYLVLAALQLLPRMQARGQTIMAAQQARGLEIEGTLLTRARGILPLLGPLVLGALGEVEERAMALEARAFRAPTPKTSLRPLHDTAGQRVMRWMLVFGGLSILLLTRWRL